MAWNEPGGNGKDPWSGKGGDQGPPDLDEVVKKLQDKFGGIFGGGKPSRGGSSVGGGSGPGSKSITVIVVIALIVWIASGIYIVEPAERGVVLRFGAYSETTQPGPHWHIPFPVERRILVNVDQISSFRHKAQMLTRDENIVDVEFTIQSRIQDAADFLFQDRDPNKTLRDATETAVREIIGKSDLDFILTQGRGAIADRIKTGAQGLVDTYKTGLIITSVNMQPAKPPEQVKSAFDDAIKAREDKERLENQAEAYANEVVPKARGEAARRLADANAYRDRVIAEAEGDVSRFLAILKEYRREPEVTRERLYLDAIESMLGQSSKVMLDTAEGGNSLMYLPLDKLIQSDEKSNTTRQPQFSTQETTRSQGSSGQIRNVDRTRGSR
ncbi:MAG: HflK protein [gamma proteobacterium symbiont of Ctena orbiculata]|uniref:Protein HflK n=1 Tax=Candidatus Thiodiazotropha taylori TaxID=2792791 RepID=A0A944M7Y5_9GAMM|nr:FtsH protease activity modulator HflK [Candidatus Thiodiazotropha taylori]PUB81592.1 MAG: FtsH protease activity modulator HflK [gamma proteobacterium symbiont of Ctena orbiculata]MBT2988750.1 FtsH protease activity modulator HflK [Candidatus Thiodiazotropha taylori]MBT2996683.1 FtsH protease activity modulator HflK [Candidatus Thiodiazotropha taylori]MBT3001445.1 FtsH protease activity modulator HflK [Candidatus Thiodiazotropha taylori]